MRFNTLEEVIAWADKAALEDYKRHVVIHTDPDGTQWQVDKNPYCTQGARSSWKRGFNNEPAHSWESNLAFDYQYQRGAAMARLIAKQTTEASDEHI